MNRSESFEFNMIEFTPAAATSEPATVPVSESVWGKVSLRILIVLTVINISLLCGCVI